MTELIYKGSTKDIYHISSEELMFKFSNRYSIFDYGEMPDQIDLKGSTTAAFTYNIYKNFEKILGIKTHILRPGILDDEIVVRKFNVPRDFDSSVFYQKRPVNAFIPLEVIFRFGVPKGSSLINKGYKVFDRFEKVMIDFTTKLESIDRPIDYSEAKKISGLNEIEFNSLLVLTEKIANNFKNLVESKGLTLWDGKFEFAFGELKNETEREIILVDSISLDELRITLNGMQLSKEILRQIYKEDPWYQELCLQKKIDKDNFRSKINTPKKLDQKTLKLISEMYTEVQSLLASENRSLDKLNEIITELKNEHNCLR